MLIFLTTLLGTLSSMFRSRAVLELENLALRHQIGVLQRSARNRCKLTQADRLFWVWLSRLWRDWRSALAIVKPETVVAWHRCRLSPVLDLEGAVRPTRTARDSPRDPRPDPPDVPGEFRLGCTPHPRRAAQTGYRHRREQRQQIHAARPQADVSDLTHLPGQSPHTAGLHRLLHRADPPFPSPVRVSGSSP